MVEPADAAETVQEAAEEEAADQRVDRFRRRAALLVAGLAGLLAIASLAGSDVTTQIINDNILVTDTYAFYQAKNIRQTSTRLAADELTSLLEVSSPPAPVRASIEQRIARHQAEVARLESEPETGEGKQELLAKARTYERQRDRAQRRDPNFDFAEALFQIGIVLGSVAVVAVSRPVVLLALAAGGLALLLMLNGFFLWVDLPFG